MANVWICCMKNVNVVYSLIQISVTLSGIIGNLLTFLVIQLKLRRNIGNLMLKILAIIYFTSSLNNHIQNIFWIYKGASSNLSQSNVDTLNISCYESKQPEDISDSHSNSTSPVNATCPYDKYPWLSASFVISQLGYFMGIWIVVLVATRICMVIKNVRILDKLWTMRNVSMYITFLVTLALLSIASDRFYHIYKCQTQTELKTLEMLHTVYKLVYWPLITRIIPIVILFICIHIMYKSLQQKTIIQKQKRDEESRKEYIKIILAISILSLINFFTDQMVTIKSEYREFFPDAYMCNLIYVRALASIVYNVITAATFLIFITFRKHFRMKLKEMICND